VLAGNGACETESHIGLALYPGLNITAAPEDHLGPEGMIVSASITQPENMNGPAAVQFTVEYTAQIRTEGNPEVFTGTTNFFFFATGRIVRRDEFTPFMRQTLQAGISPFGCSDNAVTGYFLTSYWAFDQAGATIVDGNGAPIVDGASAACTLYAGTGNGIAVSYGLPAGSTTRYGVNDTASHVLDFVPGDSPMITNDFFAVTSAAQIGTDRSCGELLADLADLPLFINGIDHTTNEFGVYTDDMPRGDTIVSITSGDEVIPRGSAVILNVGASTHAVVTRDPEASNPPAFVQRLDDTQVLFVFKDEIGRDETISIELF
jgi:hypothetical protein